MSTGEQIYRALQTKARSDAASHGTATPTAEYLSRHALESFLFRLTCTEHADSFVLKGGILLAAYGVRRPTKDVDAEAVSASVTPDQIIRVVHDIAAVDVEDGLTFDLETITVQEIRERAEYPGLRLRVNVRIGSWKGVAAWDISTGDPIVPMPHTVTIPRLLGANIEVTGYRPETVIAEKGVTILERGTTSTRWRDYLDIVQLAAQYAIDRAELRRSAEAVAQFRKVDLKPIRPVVKDYGDTAQVKWAAWRRKEGFEEFSAENLDDQMVLVAEILDPVFGQALNEPG
ncbi:nucleotidyl transferase AbiEii/AbiGii toxin family protein [Leekyejoonella antrihumi]|uniref:Nucleotidyl transferase AbiEii/AbiGii toxin family protein n=1 Tax=Leekyejoonella antrihumi TaxID=1660198 RepID=A0A563DUJ1_9MICO|nr:nucleotidyl transferase AbiEii/AbiGii toxin family protein [Leekyejoonella antrihumi]TWP33849.1 nucleotidyl transferase AbiEii/AbiGii toxin family protein [Leekyejoonella antrihumi]